MAVVLAIVLAVVAVSAFLPRPGARAGVMLALATAAFLWLAEGLGGMLAGGGTDPNSGPLLALLALAFWPLASAALPATGQQKPATATQPASPEGT
jgi:drug/metabolite transporter (DMT)-like permease